VYITNDDELIKKRRVCSEHIVAFKQQSDASGGRTSTIRVRYDHDDDVRDVSESPGRRNRIRTRRLEDDKTRAYLIVFPFINNNRIIIEIPVFVVIHTSRRPRDHLHGRYTAWPLKYDSLRRHTHTRVTIERVPVRNS